MNKTVVFTPQELETISRALLTAQVRALRMGIECSTEAAKCRYIQVSEEYGNLRESLAMYTA